ncbi:MAG: MMPL family transporter, partial [Chloroflexota bacterium]|nr:MMPL family transporter [Chloroflexota bacterium]
IIEARNGDILTQECLYDLYRNEQTLRESDLAPFLYIHYSSTNGIAYSGVFTIADSVNSALILQSGGTIDLSNATNAQVKAVIDVLFSDPATEGLREELSIKSSESDDGWTSPALIFSVLSNNQKVREEYPAFADKVCTEEIALEYFGRDVLEILRGDEDTYEMWGVAIDLNLEVKDESQIAIVLTGIAVALISLLLLITFRSWLIMFVVTTGLGMLIVWLKGFSNLIGLKSSMTLDLIVPIAIVVLGVDYAIQALFRYREEGSKGKNPQQAFGSSTYHVGKALVLAMLTTVVAFASNASSGIESVIGFATAASFAMFVSLIILGFFVPAVIMRIDDRRCRAAARRSRIGKLPSAVNRNAHTDDMRLSPRANKPGSIAKKRRRGSAIGRAISGVSNAWYVVLPIILIVTGFAAYGWLNVETKMDVKDALDPASDFVIAVDKVDEHLGETTGEPAYLYVEGDLTSHEALAAIVATIANMDDDQHVGRSLIDNKPSAHVPLFNLLKAVIEEDYAKERIAAASGVEITDLNGDYIPDTREQLRAIYEYITANGIPQDENTLRYSAKYVKEAFVYGESESGSDATFIIIGVPGTGEQEISRASSDELNADMDAALSAVSDIESYGLTGSAYIRLVQFDAISQSLTSSLSIAGLAVLLLLLIVFRSLRYSIITILPVLLVACWLYGFMYIAGYSLNMLTATIAALSIGVGIDFSIHFTERFREELNRIRRRKLPPGKKAPTEKALRRFVIYKTGRTTGFALSCTAITTIVGFAVIAFAPMPAFSTFGVLTAIMISLSIFMALFFLPSLLLLFAPVPRKTASRAKKPPRSASARDIA